MWCQLQAYKKLSLIYHPDKMAGLSKEEQGYAETQVSIWACSVNEQRSRKNERESSLKSSACLKSAKAVSAQCQSNVLVFQGMPTLCSATRLRTLCWNTVSQHHEACVRLCFRFPVPPCGPKPLVSKPAPGPMGACSVPSLSAATLFASILQDSWRGLPSETMKAKAAHLAPPIRLQKVQTFPKTRCFQSSCFRSCTCSCVWRRLLLQFIADCYDEGKEVADSSVCCSHPASARFKSRVCHGRH